MISLHLLGSGVLVRRTCLAREDFALANRCTHPPRDPRAPSPLPDLAPAKNDHHHRRHVLTVRAALPPCAEESLHGLRLFDSRVRSTGVSISSAFDAGNIEVVSNRGTAEPLVLKIKPDPHTELEKKQHSQWFYFRSTVAAPAKVSYEINNAGATSFPTAWAEAQVCASTDRKVWTRVGSTRYDAERGALQWTYEHDRASSVFFAFFDP
jgi:hypothetical protein